MEFTIVRYRKAEEAADGHMFLGSERFCDTSENVGSMLPAGTYRVERLMCKQYWKLMPVLFPERKDGPRPDWAKTRWNGCSCCKRTTDEVYLNTTLPVVCPMLKAGNGVYGRADGSIIMGRRIVPGCLSHPLEPFERLSRILQKAAARKEDVRLRITEELG